MFFFFESFNNVKSGTIKIPYDWKLYGIYENWKLYGICEKIEEHQNEFFRNSKDYYNETFIGKTIINVGSIYSV
jgi:hypothetical protein